MIACYVDPTTVDITLHHHHFSTIPCNGASTLVIDVTEGVREAILLSFVISSTGNFKFILKQGDPSTQVTNELATLFNSSVNKSINLDLGNRIPPNQQIVVEVINMDYVPCDAYITVRYLKEDAYSKFSGQLDEQLADILSN